VKAQGKRLKRKGKGLGSFEEGRREAEDWESKAEDEKLNPVKQKRKIGQLSQPSKFIPLDP
jgi:hypothetical protein